MTARSKGTRATRGTAKAARRSGLETGSRVAGGSAAKTPAGPRGRPPKAPPAAMRACLSFISLGVRDVAASRRFYESLGLVASERSGEAFVLFQLNGVVLALTSRATLLKEAGLAGGRSRPGPTCLSHNVRSPEEVDGLLQVAAKSGARVVKAASPASWGGRCGWFEDPDGHLWEIVHNPRMAMDAAGNVFLEPPGVW